jgi:hypothetical protein
VKDRLAVYMLDVGQGDSTIVLLPDDPMRAVIFDCADDHVLRKVGTSCSSAAMRHCSR